MISLLLHGGRVIDPASGFDGIADVLVDDGVITAVGRDAGATAGPDTTRIDCTGLLVTPGLMDLHAHVMPGLGDFCVPADTVGRRAGVPVVIDGGTSGVATFDLARAAVIDHPARDQGPALHRSQPAVPGDEGLHLPQAGDRQRPAQPRRGVAGRLPGAQRRHHRRAQGARLPRRRRPALAVPRRGPAARRRPAGDGPPGPASRTRRRSPRRTAASAAQRRHHHPRVPRWRRPARRRRPASRRSSATPSSAACASTSATPAPTSASARPARLFDLGYLPHTISTDLNVFNIGGPVFSLTDTMSKVWAMGVDLPAVIAHGHRQHGHAASGGPTRSARWPRAVRRRLSVLRIDEHAVELSDGFESITAERRLVAEGCVRAGTWMPARLPVPASSMPSEPCSGAAQDSRSRSARPGVRAVLAPGVHRRRAGRRRRPTARRSRCSASELAVARQASGGLLAVADRCLHRSTRLSVGWVDGECAALRLPRLALGRRRPLRGDPVDAGRADPRAGRASRRTTSSSSYGLVWVRLDGSAAADRRIPALPGLRRRRPMRIVDGRAVHLAGRRARRVENFVDLAHFAWVHDGSLGRRDQPVPPLPTITPRRRRAALRLRPARHGRRRRRPVRPLRVPHADAAHRRHRVLVWPAAPTATCG